MKAVVGDKIRIRALAADSNGNEDPRAEAYKGREGTVEMVDSMGILHGTWGSLGILPEDFYDIIDHRPDSEWRPR